MIPSASPLRCHLVCCHHFHGTVLFASLHFFLAAHGPWLRSGVKVFVCHAVVVVRFVHGDLVLCSWLHIAITGILAPATACSWTLHFVVAFLC